MYSDCVCVFVFIVYSYLLNSIVPLMSMKFPVKQHRGQIIYLSAKIFLGKNPSVANPLFSDICIRSGLSGWSASFMLWGIYCLVLYFFKLNSKLF